MNKTNVGQWASQSHAGRILLLGILVLVLQIPINAVESLVFERSATQRQAVDEIQQKWGGEQKIVGPLLVIPYQVRHYWTDAVSGAKETKTEIKRAVFLPDTLDVSNHLNNETRYRGIFEVPLYQATVTLDGQFSYPQFDQWDINPDDVLWDKARLLVMVSDARAIQKQAAVNWNGTKLYFEPGTDETMRHKEGYHVDLKNIKDGTALGTEQFTFSIELMLNGSKGLYAAPLGKDSLVNIHAPWPDPSFQGKWLPTSRNVNQDGFVAQWQIPYLGRNFPQQSRDFSSIQANIDESLVGVALISPIDHYRMSERSIKYQLLFLFLTFTVIWLIELLAKLQVHIMQYLLIGAGLCTFYLLELSLSEHLGFYWAYGMATTAIVVMVSAYSYVVLQTGKRAAVIGASLTALYLYLFTLLQEQNYALLIGSVGLFVMLTIVMYITRHIDWFKITQSPRVKNGSA